MVALAGACVLAAGAYLQYGDDRAGASSSPSSPAAAPTSPAAASSSRTTAGARPPSGGASPSVGRAPATVRLPSAARGRPVKVAVQQLGVTAPVVGINAAHGALTPPSDPSMVGWWSGGAQPGAARGSAVITGHTVHDGGGAFDNLDKLVPGSVVVVSTVRGSLRYRVATVTTYRKATLAKRAAQLFDQSVRGRLVLVTCEDWNGKVYLSNVVVLALPMA